MLRDQAFYHHHDVGLSRPAGVFWFFWLPCFGLEDCKHSRSKDSEHYLFDKVCWYPMLEHPIKFVEKKQDKLHDAVPSVLVAALGIETLRMIFFCAQIDYSDELTVACFSDLPAWITRAFHFSGCFNHLINLNQQKNFQPKRRRDASSQGQVWVLSCMPSWLDDCT